MRIGFEYQGSFKDFFKTFVSGKGMVYIVVVMTYMCIRLLGVIFRLTQINFKKLQPGLWSITTLELKYQFRIGIIVVLFLKGIVLYFQLIFKFFQLHHMNMFN